MWPPWPATHLNYWVMRSACRKWRRLRGRWPSLDSAPAKSFRNTKSFTGVCWSALHRERQGWHHRFVIPAHEDAPMFPSFVAINSHSSCLSIEDLEPFGDVGYADAGSAQARRLFQKICRAHTHAVIFDFNDEMRIGEAAAQVDASPIYLR